MSFNERTSNFSIKKEIEKRKANMTTYYGKSQIYNHLSSNIEERVWMNKYEDNGIGYLSHGTDGVLIEKMLNI